MYLSPKCVLFARFDNTPLINFVPYQIDLLTNELAQQSLCLHAKAKWIPESDLVSFCCNYKR